MCVMGLCDLIRGSEDRANDWFSGFGGNGVDWVEGVG